jgi:all-trans-retinol 13,14-reductase
MRAGFLRWASRTTAEVLREITTNPELTGVLTAQWGDYGLPPGESSFGIHAIVARHYFGGGNYPVGGASRIAETIAPLIDENGGTVVVSAEVSQVLLDGAKAAGVRMADGREFRAPIVISDAGARNTFERLVRAPEVAGWRSRAEACATVPPSMAHLSLYVGVKKTAAELGIDGTNIWAMPGYDHDANVARYMAGAGAPFPMVFISFPSAKDPDFERRHPGRATIEVVTLAAYDWFARWQDTRWRKRGADYEAFKQDLATRLQSELERHVPAVAGHVDHAELSTPITTRHFMNHEHGEAYGLSVTPRRFELRCLSPRTPIRGLYLTGQDVTSLGVSGAMFGGVVTASAVLGRNLMSTVSKAQPARTQPATREQKPVAARM